MKSVWLLTKGSGMDGDEWGLISIFSTEELATKAKEIYESTIVRKDGTSYILEANIEKWDLNE